jgi:hypothetical protein
MNAPRPKLRFRPDGTFVIVQLTDIHWHNGEPEDQRSRALIERVLDAERPDLVALTGDVVGGYDSRDPADALRQAVAPLLARGVPWAMVFGNHDDEGYLSRLDLLRVQQELPLCLTQRGPETLTGVGNYVLRLASARGPALAAALYFLDSGSYTSTGPGGYAWIAPDQIAWYRRQAQSLARAYAQAPPGVPRAERLPALAFFHLPLPEYEDVWDCEPCVGLKYEPVCCPALNSGFFTALVEAGDVMGTFVGHDHVNDFTGERYGVRLCYGRAGGYSSYGCEGMPRGARVIRLSEGQRTFDTWLRLDDGTVPAAGPPHLPAGRRAGEADA